MEIKFTCEYGSLSSVIENVYKPIFDFCIIEYKRMRDKSIIAAGINMFKNKCICSEICDPNFIGFNIRYITADMLHHSATRKVQFTVRKEDIPIMFPSIPVFKPKFHGRFLEIK